MKKHLIYIPLIALIGMGFTACTEKDKEGEFATYTVEENKENIEDEGVKAVDMLDGMKDVSAVYAVQDLARLLKQENSNMYGAVSGILSPIAGINKNVMGLTSLRYSEEEYNSISDFLDEDGGVYTYDREDGAFNFEQGGNEIIILYPIGSSKSNNGKIAIDNYSGDISNNADFGDFEMPKSLNITMTSGQTTILDLAMKATYNEDDVPSSESTTLSFKEGYTFSQKMTNDDKNIKWDFAFALDNKNIINGQFNTEGDYSYRNLTSNDGFGDDLSQTSEILETANAFVQIGNIKAVGSIDFRDLYDNYLKRNPEVEGGSSSRTEVDHFCEVLNKDAIIRLTYADNNSIIAQSSFYTFQEKDYYYNGYSYVSKPYYVPRMDFVFEDGSTIDESFFDTGFNKLLNAFEDLVSETEDNYNN